MSDGIDPAFRSASIIVSAVHFTSSSVLNNVPTGSAVNATFTAAGGTGGYSYSPSGLPCCLSLSPAGALSGTLNGVGNFGFEVTVTDSSLPPNSFTGQFSIDAIGTPALLPSINLRGLANDPVNSVGGNLSWNVAVENGGTAPFTWTVAGLPPGVSYRPYTAAPGTMTPGNVQIWGTPTAVGAYPVTYTVTDNSGVSASVTSTMTISAIAPDFSTFLQDGTVGTAYSYKFRALGGTSPYSLSQVNPLTNPLPAGLTLNTSTFTLSGTPQENARFNPNFLLQDSQGNKYVMLTGFNIASGGNPQITLNDYFLGNASVGSPFSYQLSACCSSSGQYTYSAVDPTKLPPGINLASTGAFSGTPTTPGIYFFLVKAADTTTPGNAGYKQVVVSVTSLQVTSNANLPSGNVGARYNYAIQTSGASGPVSFQMIQGGLPQGVTLSTGGVLNGTPANSGQFQFFVEASDTGGSHVFSGFNVSIGPALCSVSGGATATITDAQAVINQALGTAPPQTDVNGDGVINIIDVQIVVNAVMGKGCTP